MPSTRPGRRPDPATRRRWHQRLDRFRKSGVAVADFCEREGISTASFYAWRRRLQHNPPLPADDAPRLVPVRLVSPLGAVKSKRATLDGRPQRIETLNGAGTRLTTEVVQRAAARLV